MLLLVAPLCLMAQEVLVGATDTLSYMSELRGRRVALLANHTAMYSPEEHVVDMLHREGVNIVGIFSPEHGFRGGADAGEHVANSTDENAATYEDAFPYS